MRRVDAEQFIALLKKDNIEISYASLNEICEALGENVPDLTTSYNSDTIMEETPAQCKAELPETNSGSLSHTQDTELHKITMEDINKTIAKLDKQDNDLDPATVLPQYLHRHLSLFNKAESDKLPPHRPEDDCEILLQPGKTPKAARAFNMNEAQLRVLKKTLTEELRKGFIRPSKSPAASPVLFARKPGGGLRFCIDYRALNNITIKNRYPLPLIQDTLHQLSHAKFYTKLDVIAAFNKVWV